MKKQHVDEIKGIVVLALGLLLLASLISFVPDDLSWYTSHPNSPAHNWIRIVGAYSAGALLLIFGYSAYFLAVFLFFWSWNKFIAREIKFTFAKMISALILFCVISALFSMTGPQESTLRFERSGITGFLLSDFLVQYLGWAGAYIVLFMLGALTLVVTGEVLVSPLLFKSSAALQEMLLSIKERALARKDPARSAAPVFKAKTQSLPTPRPPVNLKDMPSLREKLNLDKSQKTDKKEEVIEKNIPRPFPPKEEKPIAKPVAPPPPEKPAIRIVKTEEPKELPKPKEPAIVGDYHLPTIDLLNDPPKVSSNKIQGDLEEGARTLESTLADFNVIVRVADIERGPVITRYELEPAPGVKVQKITTLADDIALAMRASTIRIVAPIPGKNRVGIEVPNGTSASVYLKDVLMQSSFQNSSSKLMLGIGKTISGEPLIADLADMPHLLIAGTTGSGKTVCVNSLIMSMLFNAGPDDVKFLMVDPKMVELTPYNPLPHMLCPVVTDAKKVSAALNWVVGEMESRYATLSKEGVRNIKAYQARGHKMPYIVILIDELADLMQVAAKTIESAITRLAQLSRAVGIHLVLATQRPSVDVITGVIKANFPARISFKVASKVDSRTVLDMNGAENLIGKGDLLFIKPGDAKPTRGQCSFVSDEEVNRVIEFIKKQQEPVYDDTILRNQISGGAGGSDEKDELYDEAVRLVIETNQASVSILQRRMRLGYTRAARLIDMMEQHGLVGPYCGSKPRDILIDREEWLLKNMKNQENASTENG